MNSKRILALILTLILSLAMTTGGLAGNVEKDIQKNAQKTPIASVTENGVTIEVSNTAADKHCAYVLLNITMPKDISLENNAFWRAWSLDTESEFVEMDTASNSYKILNAEGSSMTILIQYEQTATIKGKKATLEFEDFGYFNPETTTFITLLEGKWNLKFDFKFEGIIDLQPNTEIAVNGVTGTLASVSISPLSVFTAVTAPGKLTDQVMKLSPVITFKDGSKTIYDEKSEHLGGHHKDAITTMISNYIFEDSISLENIDSISLGGLTIPVSQCGEAPALPQPESPSDWAKEQVTAAVNAGIVPDELLKSYTKATTRGEFCALAVRIYETVTNREISERKQFSDTDDINVQKMAGLDIAQGVGDGIFAPERNLTREQAATLLARLAAACNKNLEAQAPGFSDNSTISSWAMDAVGQVQKAGIMSGVGENRFAPQDDYTREQSIMTMMRLFDLVK